MGLCASWFVTYCCCTVFLFVFSHLLFVRNPVRLSLSVCSVSFVRLPMVLLFAFSHFHFCYPDAHCVISLALVLLLLSCCFVNLLISINDFLCVFFLETFFICHFSRLSINVYLCPCFLSLCLICISLPLLTFSSSLNSQGWL